MPTQTSVYRAIADFSQLRREARGATADLKELKAQGNAPTGLSNAFNSVRANATSAGAATTAYSRQAAGAAVTSKTLAKETHGAATGLKEVDNAASGLSASIGTAGPRLSSFITSVGALRIAAVSAGVAVGALAAVGVKAGITFNATQESLLTAFTTILRDGDKARLLLAQIVDVARVTPFETNALAGQVQKLLAYGFSLDQVLTGTGIEARGLAISIGSAVAAMGGGATELESVTRAFGQIFAKGKVSAEELRQLAESGLPVYAILQEKLGLTAAQVQDIGNLGVDALTGINALVEGFDQRFGGAMAAQSQTFNGLISTLKDNISIGLGSATQALFVAAKDGLGVLGNALTEFNTRASEIGFFDTLEEKLPAVAQFLTIIQGLFVQLKDIVVELLPFFGALAQVFATIVGGGLLLFLNALAAALGVVLNIIEALPDGFLQFAGGVTAAYLALIIFNRVLTSTLVRGAVLPAVVGLTNAFIALRKAILAAYLASFVTGGKFGGLGAGIGSLGNSIKGVAAGAGQLSKNVLGSVGALSGLATAGTGAAVATGGVVLALVAVAAAAFIVNKVLSDMEERNESTAEAADKLAESLGLQKTAMEEVEEAAEQAADGTSQAFAEANSRILQRIREVRAGAREPLLLQLGFDLISAGFSAEDAYKAIQETIVALGPIGVGIEITLEDLQDPLAQLVAVRKNITELFASGNAGGGIQGQAGQDLAGIAATAKDLVDNGNITQAIALINEAEQAIKDTNDPNAAQFLDILSDEFAKLFGPNANFSLTELDNLPDLLQQISNDNVSASASLKEFANEVLAGVASGKSFETSLKDVTAAHRLLDEQTTKTAATQSEMTATTTDEAAALRELTADIDVTEAGLKNLAKALDDFSNPLKALELSQTVLSSPQEAIKAAEDEARENAKASADAANKAAQEEVDRWNKAHPKNKRKAIKIEAAEVVLSTEGLTKALEDSVKQQNAWERNLDRVGKRAARILGPGSAALVSTLRGMGESGEQILEALANGSDRQFKRIVAAMDQLVPETKKSFKAWQDELDAQLEAKKEWAKNITILMARGAVDLANALIEQGPDSASTAAGAAELSDRALRRLNRKVGQGAGITEKTVGADSQALRTLLTTGGLGGNQTPRDIASALGIDVKDLQPLLRRLQPIIDLLSPKQQRTAKKNIEFVTSVTGDLEKQEFIGLLNLRNSTVRPEFNSQVPSAARAMGGISSYAFGKLPKDAMIKSAQSGLIQWAEPSTNGEAFIPFAADRRPRALNIWAETGKRLGALPDGPTAMDIGGFRHLAMGDFAPARVRVSAGFANGATSSSAPTSNTEHIDLRGSTIVANDPMAMLRKIEAERRLKSLGRPRAPQL